MTKRKEPEELLLAYWKRKLGPKFAKSSPWNRVVNRVTPDYLHDINNFARTDDGMAQERSRVSRLIFQGDPLNRSQYYFALACGLLMGDRPYLEFFKHRWWETSNGYGYGVKTKGKA